MDRWTRDFDNWGICDTVCMHLYDRTPHAWGKAALWSKRKDEFVRRAGFALMASLALHDKEMKDEPFQKFLRLVEGAASDDRNFVKKAVNWALRAIGERNLALNASAVAIAKRLAASESATERWVGKDALRQLATPAATKRLASRDRAAALRAAKPKRREAQDA
jgi:3-methyladenine DNA glycosylase AlkD